MIAVIWSDRHNVLWVCAGLIMCLSKTMMFSKLIFSAAVNYLNSLHCIINVLLCFLALPKHSRLVSWILFCIFPLTRSINFMSAFLSAMLPPCQAAAPSSKVSFPVSREGFLHQPGCCLHFIFPLMYNPIHCWDTFSAFFFLRFEHRLWWWLFIFGYAVFI